MAPTPRASPYDAHAAAYEAYTARREPCGVAGEDPLGLLPRPLDVDHPEVAAAQAAGRPPGSPGSAFPAGEQLPRLMVPAFGKPPG